MLLEFFDKTNFFKFENADGFDYHKLLLFFILYSETQCKEDKVKILFYLMADEQADIYNRELMDNNDPMISCSRGPAKHVIEILTTLTSSMPAEVIKDSL